MNRLEQQLGRHRAVRVHAIEGMGKSALVREAAHRWTRAGLFPDGACCVSFVRGAGIDQVVQILGTYLEGSDFERVPAGERAQHVGRLFGQRRVLMVWDRFESVLLADPEDGERHRVLELLGHWTEDPEGRGRLLLTCGPVEEAGPGVELPGIAEMELAGLAPPDALRRLESSLDLHGVDATEPRLSPPVPEALVESLEGHPLAIEIVASFLKDSAPEEILAALEEVREGLEGGAATGSRRTLRALLELAVRRLGEPARKALPALGLFRGGVFESLWLHVSGMEPEAWEAARRELEAMGLVRVESGGILHEDRPYLDLHPALACGGSANLSEEGSPREVRARFVNAYHGLATSVWHVLFHTRGHHRGLDLVTLEEGNFRLAARWAVEAGALAEAADLADTLGEALRRSGRLGEQERWAAGLAAEVGRRGYGEETALREHAAAWALFNGGRASEAVVRLEGLLGRLEAAKEIDAAELLATTRLDLGRIYHARGQSNRAIVILEKAVADWQALVERERTRSGSGSAEKRKLAATLGVLANARITMGRFDGALASLAAAARLAADLGEHGESAAGLAQMAQILEERKCFSEAEDRYGQAVEAARRAGDLKLEATLLQYRGGLAETQESYGEAAELYRRALELFHELEDSRGLAQTCNLLGVLGHKMGFLTEARAWHEQSRNLARELEDREMLGVAARNLGALCRQEGEAAWEEGDEAAANRFFEQAAALLEESLASREGSGDRWGLADSHGQLAQIRLLLGDLDQAEETAHRARSMREQLGLEGVWQDYQTLAGIARARGDEAAAGEWEGKRDDQLAEMERRAS